MLRRSAQFDKELEHDHFSVVRGDLYREGKLVLEDMVITGGSWTDDKTAAIRRRATMTLFPKPELIPALSYKQDLGLWPVANEVQLKVGVRYASGAVELLPVARLRISKPVLVDDGQSLSLSIDGFDRSRAVSRARFTKPYVIPSGTDYATAIHDLIRSRIPSLVEDDFDFMTTDGSEGRVYRTPLLTFLQDDDPWEMAQTMAQSFGAEVFFDGTGKCVLQPERDPSMEMEDWHYHEGHDGALLSIERALDDEQAYNGVIVDSGNSELPQPIHAEFWDTNPESPTYYDPGDPSASSYGPVPYFMESQYITTQAQADAAAANNFLRVTGISENVSFSSFVHPAHEAGDIIMLERQRINVDGTYVLDNFTCGLGYTGVMQGTCRERRVL